MRTCGQCVNNRQCHCPADNDASKCYMFYDYGDALERFPELQRPGLVERIKAYIKRHKRQSKRDNQNENGTEND